MVYKLEDCLGREVVITQEHESYDGITREVGDRAHVYTGCTYGCLGSNEVPLVFGKSLPFQGTDERYFTEVAE